MRQKQKSQRYQEAYILEGMILSLGEQISGELERRQMTRTQLAEKLNTSKAYITKLLNGNPNITLKTIVRISMALEINLRLEAVAGPVSEVDLSSLRERSHHKFSRPTEFSDTTCASADAQSVIDIKDWIPSRPVNPIHSKESLNAFPTAA